MKFDFVLVGGGTSACVLASQILTNSLGSVAIIESGGGPIGPRVFTPIRYTEMFESQWDFGLATVPQARLANRRLNWPRGRMLGGSSGMNAMIYLPPTDLDMQGWPNGWGFSDIKSSILNIENRLFGDDYCDPPIHPLSQRFLDAIDEQNQFCGVPDTLESCRYRRTQRLGRRHAAYTAFLKPFLQHPMLTIIKHANVSRVLFHDTRATHVEFQRNEETCLLSANVAVVLSAGTVFSPTILFRSGIGPKEPLAASGIDTRIDLSAVGANLQDHLVVPLVFKSKIDSLERTFSPLTRKSYIQDRTGAKISNIAEVGAFFKLDSSSSIPKDDAPGSEIQLHFTPTHYFEYSTRPAPTNAWTIAVTQRCPSSRGVIQIVPDSELNYMIRIDPKYLEEQCDLERLIEGVKQTLQLTNRPSLSCVRASMLLPKATGDDQIAKHIQRYAMSLYHPVGTCSIGSDPASSVVDSRLRVHGTDNFYVADASVIPRIPLGNPQSFAMLVGYQMAKILCREG